MADVALGKLAFRKMNRTFCSVRTLIAVLKWVVTLRGEGR